MMMVGQAKAQPVDTCANTGDINKTVLASAIITQSTIYVGGISFLGFIWYKDHERVPFHYYNDAKG
jgi:hypothetical protein